MNKNSRGYPKFDIVVYRVNMEHPDQSRQAFELLKATDKALEYPFGYKKLKLFGPVLQNSGYIVYATIFTNADDYLRCCASSLKDELIAICKVWIQQFCPDKEQYFNHLCHEANRKSLLKNGYPPGDNLKTNQHFIQKTSEVKNVRFRE